MAQFDKINLKNVEDLKVSELKEYLKLNNCVCTGEKGTLLFRAKAFIEGKEEKMKVNGINPALLKAADLRKECASFLLSPIGSNDELLERLLPKLRDRNILLDTNDFAASNDQLEGPKLIAKRILDLAEDDDWDGILSVLGDKLNSSSDPKLLRKTYLKLSLLVNALFINIFFNTDSP